MEKGLGDHPVFSVSLPLASQFFALHLSVNITSLYNLAIAPHTNNLRNLLISSQTKLISFCPVNFNGRVKHLLQSFILRPMGFLKCHSVAESCPK